MKFGKMLLIGILALGLSACASDPNAVYPDAGAGNSLGSFLAQPANPSTPGPTVNVNVNYPNHNSFGNFKTANGTAALAASNQNQLAYSIMDAVNDKLTDLGFKLPQGFLSTGSRTLNITISNLSFSYQGKTIVATCTINLQAAAGTFEHMQKTYTNSVAISNSPPASQAQVIQAVGQALNNSLQQMMADQQMIQFIQ